MRDRETGRAFVVTDGPETKPFPIPAKADTRDLSVDFLRAQKGGHTMLIAGVLLGLLLAQSPKVAKQWEKAVILRLGRYVGLRGPGLFWLVPLIDTISAWIDQRVITTSFAAEQTLTSDTVPVNVDAVLFWMVYDPEKAALEVQDYPQAVSWAAQTALRCFVTRTMTRRATPPIASTVSA